MTQESLDTENSVRAQTELLVSLRQVHSSPEPTKPAWQIFLESVGGAALITALVATIIGGIVVASISASIQEHQRDREFRQTWLKARGDQALVAYKEYVDKEQQLTKHTYDLLGDCIATADTLIEFSTSDFNPARFVGTDRKEVITQRAYYRHQFNLADDNWDKEKESLGLQLAYYHQSSPETTKAWLNLDASLAKFRGCAKRWSIDHDDLPVDQADQACKSARDALRDSISQLTASLQATRRYAWEGWASADTMEGALEHATKPSPTGSPAAP